MVARVQDEDPLLWHLVKFIGLRRFWRIQQEGQTFACFTCSAVRVSLLESDKEMNLFSEPGASIQHVLLATSLGHRAFCFFRPLTQYPVLLQNVSACVCVCAFQALQGEVGRSL